MRSLPIERRFPAGKRRAAERDWVFFLLEELNGLADVLRFRQETDPQAPVDETLARAGAIVAALGWQAGTAVTHTWAFVQTRLQFPEDAWGPHLALARFDPGPRLRAWRASLPVQTRAILDGTPTM
jgi:hypothetical protein